MTVNNTQGSHTYHTRYTTGRLRGVPQPVGAVFSKRSPRTGPIAFCVTSDLRLRAQAILRYYALRWQAETDNFVLKQQRHGVLPVVAQLRQPLRVVDAGDFVAQLLAVGQLQAMGDVIHAAEAVTQADDLGRGIPARQVRDAGHDWVGDLDVVRVAREFLQPFRASKIDAAVVALSSVTGSYQHVLDALNAANALFAVLEQDVEGDCAYAVMSANEEGAYAATKKLISDGHQRAAFLDSAQMWPAIELRLRGHRAAMREAGLEDHIVTSASPDWTSAGGATAMCALLDCCASEGRPRPSAVLAGNDVLAVGAMHVLRERSLCVPGDVAVIGFDDFEFARYVEPLLTTVRLPAFDMGYRAVEMLIQHIEGEPPAQRKLVLPTELIVRESG